VTAPDHLPQEPTGRPHHPGEVQSAGHNGGPDEAGAEPWKRPPQPSPPQTLADLGEWELIRRLGAFAPPGQFADDAALVNLNGEGAKEPGLAGQPDGLAQGGPTLVVNTDVLVEGIHFSEATTEPGDVGWRAAAANLSDLAAMGCIEVVGITVGLVAPASTPWSWVEGVYGGLRQALDTYGGVLLGGDCSGGTQRILAITAIGRLASCADPAREHAVDQAAAAGSTAAATEPSSRAWPAIRRGDGRPGDLLVCTGPHGLSRLGLALLQGAIPASATPGTVPSQGPSMEADEQAPRTAPATGSDSETCCEEPWFDPGLQLRAITAHRRPVPRFDAVRALIACRPAGEPWRVGGCDSSDGLAAAVRVIAGASGCAARLERTCLPLDPAMAGLPDAETWCLGGGEDFELVLALAPAWAEALIAALPGATRIGELVAGDEGVLGWSDGTPWSAGEGKNGAGSGYSHFR